MEQMGTMYEGEWSCVSKMYNTNEESDFIAQLLGDFNSSVTYDQSMADYDDNAEAECGANLSLSVVSVYKKPDEIRLLDSFMECKSPRKKSRKAADVKNKRSVRPKRNQRTDSSSDQTSSVTFSENENTFSGDTSTSHKNRPALNLNGKTRADRGSATDPQSLYARRRRERINERLKTLQGLVPNGTKVDISTMLEEAVEYVKFLQLQIKLLSSNDLWMYAPLAYSGMDIRLFDSKNIRKIPENS